MDHVEQMMDLELRKRIQTRLVLGWVVLIVLLSFGTYRAFYYGGKDFAVFFEAWRMVLSGQSNSIYHLKSDRFLYAPGFAWLFCWIGLLPQSWALGLWCLFKSSAVGLLVRAYEKRGLQTLAAWGVIGLARPVLIDFEYGQVNLLVLAACVWGGVMHFDKEKSSVQDVIAWFVLALAACTKLLAIPLLLLPWCVTQGISQQKLKYERMGVLLGTGLIFLIPFLSLPMSGVFNLYHEWYEALVLRGLPLESHNQSFTALLHHYLSGLGTEVRSEGGGTPLMFGWQILSSEQIHLLTLAWSFLSGGFMLGWLISRVRHKAPLRWLAVLIALLVLPSHLVWKPYFVMGIPVMMLWLNDRVMLYRQCHSVLRRGWVLLFAALLLVGINLSGFDFIGHYWASHFESAAILLGIHLILLGSVVKLCFV